MKKIMTLIIEESVELELELVDLLVTLLKDMNQIASCDCGQPGEEILMNFAARLKPCFSDTGHVMSNDCSMSVASICKTHKIKTKCLETETEVKRKRKRDSCPLEKQVSSYEDNGKICVQGYEVKQSSAQILEAIFKKYGDIAAYSIFQTSYVTPLILEVVCEIVKRIQTNEVVEKLEETERQLSDAEMANIDVTWLQAHLEAIRENAEVLKRSKPVKKTTKDILLTERAARTDLKDADAEVVAARARVEQAEMFVNRLRMVEKNWDDKILDCKARLDSWVQQPFP
ncbi:uncharacterized protein LOC143600407 [Bidens hawaiensis]|uniref:uncharacterized protein LOC143600407 n=1 Tax=Bidens hawaiensis TaxID=980011 RepID=UPI004048F523